MNRIKTMLMGLCEVLLNYFVSYIPCWWLRRAFYRVAGMKIGMGSRILKGTKVQGWNHISIGDHIYVNSYCHLDGQGVS